MIQLKELRAFFAWGLSTLFSSIFLILWAVGQAVVALVLSYIQLSGFIDQWTFTLLQVSFAVATLSPIIAYICVTITNNFVETLMEIRKELQRLKQLTDSS